MQASGRRAFGCPEEVFLPSPVTADEFSVIRNVATHPFFQRHGFGTAATARAVADGILAGAVWCCLKTSAEGYPLFRNLGFQAIEGRSVESLFTACRSARRGP